VWLPNAAAASDRPDFPAIAISPDGGDVYLVYDAFLQPWQASVLTPPRRMQGVVRHVDFATRAVTELNRGPAGDARGSSANGLTSEFIGDYNYVSAVNARAVPVWNDVRNAASCPAINTYRQMVADGTATASTTDPSRPAPNTDCPITFGNTDIYGGNYADPSPGS
jgi:hypothetical protein